MYKRVMRICLLFCIVILGGCSRDFNKEELTQIDMIRVLAIDYDEDKYIVTGLYGTGGGDTTNGEINTIDGEGESLFEAFENLKIKNKKSVSLAYTSFYLLGEGLVKHSVEDTLYYLIKDETVQMNALLYVTKEKKAADVLGDAKDNDNMIQDDLSAMVEKRLATSKRSENTILWLYEDLADNSLSMIIPYLNYNDQELTLGGYTALYDGKIKDYLDEATSIGADILRGNKASFPLKLSDGYGVMINNIKTKMVPTLQANEVVFDVTVNFNSVIRSVSNGNYTMDGLARSRVKAEQEAAIKDIVEHATEYAKKINVDIMGIDNILQKNYMIWSTLDGHYDDYLQYTKYNYTIQSLVTRSSVLEGWR